MNRRLTGASIIVLLLNLSFAGLSYAQSGSDDQGAYTRTAFTSPGQGHAVAAGQRQWYKFEYAGDESPIYVRVIGAGLQFTVWSVQDLVNSNGRFGPDATTVGRGTPNEDMGADANWMGSFSMPGTYYIMVERTNGGRGENSNVSGSYSLQVTGTGVSWESQSANNLHGQTGPSQGQSDQTGDTTQGAAPLTLPQTGGDTTAALPHSCVFVVSIPGSPYKFSHTS